MARRMARDPIEIEIAIEIEIDETWPRETGWLPIERDSPNRHGDMPGRTTTRSRRTVMTGQPEAKGGVLTAWRWPLVLLALIGAGVYLLQRCSPERLLGQGGRAAQTATTKVVELWRRFSRAQIEEHARHFVSGLPRLGDELSLVVTTLDITKHLVGESTKRQFGINFGTTRVVLSVPARIHYAVPLGGEAPVRFRVGPAPGTFVAVFPPPEVQAVEIFSADKDSVVEVGWARFRSHSGQALLDKLDRQSYDAVRNMAESPMALAVVRRRARASLARFVALYLVDQGAWDPEDGFSRLVICFADEDPATLDGFERRELRLEPDLEPEAAFGSDGIEPGGGQ
jgi:hypothetical protein